MSRCWQPHGKQLGSDPEGEYGLIDRIPIPKELTPALRCWVDVLSILIALGRPANLDENQFCDNTDEQPQHPDQFQHGLSFAVTADQPTVARTPGPG